MSNLKPIKGSCIAESDLPSSRWLPPAEFRQAVVALPLVSIDLCVVDEQQRLLLGRRKNEPAKGWWFTPGGSIRKHEPWKVALTRVAEQEIGCPERFLQPAELMGVYDHFYDSSAHGESTTHYVNLPHWLQLRSASDLDFGNADDQHHAWSWQPLERAAVDADVHPYVRVYARWLLNRLGE